MEQPTDKWILPRGIYDLLPEEATRLEAVRRAIGDYFESWGYGLVTPAHIGYLPSLLTGSNQTLAQKMFQASDPLTGERLALRTDTTPQVARIDAHSLEGDEIRRLYYQGTIMRAESATLGGQRNPMQIGAEIYGEADQGADLEVLSLVAQLLATLNCGDYVLDIGHVGIYRSLIKETSISNEKQHQLFDIVQRKATGELNDFLNRQDIKSKLSAAQVKCLKALPQLAGNATNVIKEATTLFANSNKECQVELKSLATLISRFHKRNPEVNIHIDLAELRGFQYHTGLVFAAYQKESATLLAQGGRYDNIGKAFGRSRPAIGFSSDLQALVECCEQSFTSHKKTISAPDQDDPELLEIITTLRRDGNTVIIDFNGQLQTDQKLQQQNGKWTANE